MPRRASPLGLGLRLRLMLTLTAVAIFPVAAVSYVIVRGEVRNVTRNVDFEVRDAAQTAGALFSRLPPRRQPRAAPAPSPPRLQEASGRQGGRTLARSPRRNDLLIVVGSRTYGRSLPGAFRTR